MCIKIVNSQCETPYDMNRPLEEQVSGCSQIVVNYEHFDKEVDKFLQEMQRFARTGVKANLNIKVVHNDNVQGFKIKKSFRKITQDLVLNDIIRLMALSQLEADKKLEDLASAFTGVFNEKL